MTERDQELGYDDRYRTDEPRRSDDSYRADDPYRSDPYGPRDGRGGLLATPADVGARPSRRAPRPGRQRRRGAVVALLSLVALLALVGVGGSAVVRAISHRTTTSGEPDYPGSGNGTAVRVQVRAGDSASAIGRTLAAADIVRSSTVFTRAAAGDVRARSIQPGFYSLQQQMSAKAALARLLDPKARVRDRVTIPEGSSLARTLDLIASKTSISRADLNTAVASPAALGLPAYAQGKVEGFVFPATYDVGPGTTAVGALKLMTARFAQAATTTKLEAGAAALQRTPYDIVTIASLVEREAAQPSDRPQVARVIYNRLAAGMQLGLESTLRYALGDVTTNRLTQSQIDKANANPYSTYTRTGLPPGPIAEPGEAALGAALHPAPGDALYFVTLPKSGKTVFTASESEFRQLEAQCQSQGGC